jgi:hypothetical protein
MPVDVYTPNKAQLENILLSGLALKTWNYRPIITANSAPASGTIYALATPFYAGDIISTIWLNVQVAGAGTAPTGFFVGVADSSRNMLAQSNNLNASSSLTATAHQQFALNASWTVPTDGMYYVVILENGSWGTTQMALGRGGSIGAAFGTNFEFATAGTGQTALPANGSALPSAYSSTGALGFFAAAG